MNGHVCAAGHNADHIPVANLDGEIIRAQRSEDAPIVVLVAVEKIVVKVIGHMKHDIELAP